MQQAEADAENAPLVLGYVKVRLRSRSPRLWGWEVCREGSDIVVRHSEGVFPCAEDAWRAGQIVLAAIETARPVRRIRGGAV